MGSESEGSQSSWMTSFANRRLSFGPKSTGLTSKGLKRAKVDEIGEFSFRNASSCWSDDVKWKDQEICPTVIGNEDPFSVNNLIEDMDTSRYGDVRKDMEDLLARWSSRRSQLISQGSAEKPLVPCKHLSTQKSPNKVDFGLNIYANVTSEIEELFVQNQSFGYLPSTNSTMPYKRLRKSLIKEDIESHPPDMPNIIDLEDGDEPPGDFAIVKFEPVEEIDTPTKSVVVIDLDEEDTENGYNLCHSHSCATEPVVPCQNWCVERSPSEVDLQPNKYGSVTKEVEDLLARGRVFEVLGSTNSAMSCKHLAMEMYPSKEGWNSEPPAMPGIIFLDSPDNGTIFESEPDEEIVRTAKPLVTIDLDDKALENDKNSSPDEVVDLAKTADILLEKTVEDQSRVEVQKLRRENSFHGSNTEFQEVECVTGSSQAFLWDNQVDDPDHGEGRPQHDKTELKKGKVSNPRAGANAEIVECMRETGASPTVQPKSSQAEEDKGVYVGMENDAGHEEGSAGHDKTALKKDEDMSARAMSDAEMVEDKRQIKASVPCKLSEVAKDKGAYFSMEHDANPNKGSPEPDKSELNKYKGLNPTKEPDAEMVEGERQTEASAFVLPKISEVEKDEGVYIGVHDDAEHEEGSPQHDSVYGDLGSIWNELSFALEFSKDTAVDSSSDKHTIVDAEDCDHSFILKDDIGSVCRVCGLIERGIETIIEYNFAKAKRKERSYRYDRSLRTGLEQIKILPETIRSAGHDCSLTEIAVHPRHQKAMKPHQVEGFNFLASNLLTDHPGGCILAHAPGSGKTFMIISFLQSFMAKYPSARPLIILPKGIISTWKKEFQRWQVEDIPLYDLYSSKTESRSQQLEILKKWVDERSILFLGYQQFALIVCDTAENATSDACRKILLTCPSILILDEGHTPRNQNTDILISLEQVQTSRKVVLSGTLYQNHVKEVFNILNLVRPKFLKMEIPKAIKRRILSKVQISSGKSSIKDFSNDDFYDLVESTLLEDEKFKRKVNIVQDLREMTSKVLHYYKGDLLDELPGLVDFTVFLELSYVQKKEIKELEKVKSRFKRISDGSIIYVHPLLKQLLMSSGAKDRVNVEKIDLLLEKLKETEGVKTKFYLNLLQLCESTGEKLLVFSQYLLPLKFLERLTVKLKNYSVGKEIFMITGDSDAEIRDSCMEKFNNSSDARVFFGSIKACGEGISLVGASRIIILDTHLNPSITRQAIGRAFRPGQQRKVYTYRLVAADSPEVDDHLTCFRKESVAKMWFEWNGCHGQDYFQMESVDINDCGDLFLESSQLKEDVDSLYKR